MPTKREDPLGLPVGLEEFRDGPPARVRLADGGTAWLVGGHAEARAVLADPRFSVDDSDPAFPKLLPVPAVKGALSFLRLDDPDHARMRKMLAAEFTVRRINQLKPSIEEAVDDLLDDMFAQGPPADLVADFALPLPSLVICLLLGIPYEDHDFFQRASLEFLNVEADPAIAVAAAERLYGYLTDLIAAKVAAPTDDLLGRVTAHVREGTLTEEELVLMARLLLIAGHETTANMLSLGTFTLLRTPDQLARLKADPSYAPAVTEELLRYLSIVHFGLARTAREPVEVGGVRVEAGDGLVVSLSAANRDPAHFEGDPETFDASRPPGHHVAFGFGMHTCIGAALARLEMNVALPRLFERAPGLALAVPAEEVVFRPEQFVYGVAALPVTW
ncbi:cytochrome P450 [Actinocorallia sp. A-T 12471]|uniref:cytochrome P450 n=1 Tax=Actinocorallia sp. A-T 12471 TaxID=3089813 RepID=UPI0029D3C96E|nr:cytochrome P450 [Actinocorallia sp. A-T 12471]MDX6744087.1 cytochrome P450 [Actinocorallia sp. A-T 12471]